MSIRPGSRVTPGRSMRSAPAGTASPWRSTALIRPSTITTRGFSTYLPVATSSSRSALTATVRASAPAAIAQAARPAAATIATRMGTPALKSLSGVLSTALQR